MKKLLSSPATAFSFALFLRLYTNEEGINSNSHSGKEETKIGTLVNLFDSYGWELDTTVNIEQRNKELLEIDREKTKSFLEYMSSGIEFGNSEPTQQSEDNTPKALSSTRSTMTFLMYGDHSSTVTSSQAIMILSYDGPKLSSAAIQSTSASSNPVTTQTSDEYGSFNLSGDKCDGIKATGMIKYGSIYRRRYEMVRWCLKNSSNIVDDGEVTGFHAIQPDDEIYYKQRSGEYCSPPSCLSISRKYS